MESCKDVRSFSAFIGNVIRKHGITLDGYADDIHLYISSRPDKSSKLHKLNECI